MSNGSSALKTQHDRIPHEEFCKMLKEHGVLEKGQYVMDVNHNGEIQFSRQKRYWINKVDLEGE